MTVGCVKETEKHEYRVGMTPDNAGIYTSHGHNVLMERGAGLGSGFSDGDYSAAGARIADAAEEIYASADMVVKVRGPSEPERGLLREGQIIFAYLHLAADRPLTRALLEAGVKGVAYETVRDGSGGLPLLRPMSEIAGRLSILEGAKCLEHLSGGRGILLAGVPGVPKAKVVILGGGVVGTNACRIAVGMGADVTVVDNKLERLTYLDDIFGSRIQTIFSTDTSIEKECRNADLIIGSALIPGGAAPKLIKKSYLKNMRPGSVVVDVSVDQGGCCETAKVTHHDAPSYAVDGIVHYCVGNMPGAVSRTSTLALTNATLSCGLAIADAGLERACAELPGLAKGVNCYAGRLTCPEVGEAMGIQAEEFCIS